MEKDPSCICRLTSSGVLDEADCESGGGSEQGHGEDAIEDVTEDVGVCTAVG